MTLKHQNDPELVRELLIDPGTWVVVGLSSNQDREAFGVSRWLKVELGKGIIPVHPSAETVHGEQGYASLADIPDGTDIKVVDCFVNSSIVGGVVDEVIAHKDRLQIDAVWMQLGVADEAAADARPRRRPGRRHGHLPAHRVAARALGGDGPLRTRSLPSGRVPGYVIWPIRERGRTCHNSPHLDLRRPMRPSIRAAAVAVASIAVAAAVPAVAAPAAALAPASVPSAPGCSPRGHDPGGDHPRGRQVFSPFDVAAQPYAIRGHPARTGHGDGRGQLPARRAGLPRPLPLHPAVRRPRRAACASARRRSTAQDQTSTHVEKSHGVGCGRSHPPRRRLRPQPAAHQVRLPLRREQPHRPPGALHGQPSPPGARPRSPPPAPPRASAPCAR